MFSTKTGIYGTDYLNRALVTAVGLGANRPEDAIYPTSEADAEGKPYDGANKYVMHFDKGQMPPVNGFWSLTMYNEEYFFVDNPLNRYTVSSRSKFKENADGSVDVFIQHENPGIGQGSELVARSCRKVRLDAAALLAEGKGSFDPRRLLGHPAGEDRQVERPTDLQRCHSGTSRQVRNTPQRVPHRSHSRANGTAGARGFW